MIVLVSLIVLLLETTILHPYITAHSVDCHVQCGGIDMDTLFIEHIFYFCTVMIFPFKVHCI